MRLTRREIATIQVALKCWRCQLKQTRNPSSLSDLFIDELPLSAREIDRLSDRLGMARVLPNICNEAELLRMKVPTYLATQDPAGPDTGDPSVPILIRDAEGVRLLLGANSWDDDEKPDIQIERRPHGWMIFIHPNGGDAVGFLVILDDGRTFFLHEYYTEPRLEVVHEFPPELDRP